MARLGSHDVDSFATTWFDVTADVSGWIDRDYIPFPEEPPPPPPPPPPEPLPAGGAATGGYGSKWWREFQEKQEEKWRHPFGPPKEDDPLVSLRKSIDDASGREPPDGEDDRAHESVFAIVEVPVPVYYETKGRETFTVIEVPAEPVPATPPLQGTQLPEIAPLPTAPQAEISPEQRQAIYEASEAFLGLLRQELEAPIEVPTPPKVSPWLWVAAGAVVLAAGITIGVLLTQPTPIAGVRVLPAARKRPAREKAKKRKRPRRR